MRLSGFNTIIDYSSFFKNNNTFKTSTFIDSVSFSEFNMLKTGAYKKMVSAYQRIGGVLSDSRNSTFGTKPSAEMKGLSTMRAVSEKLTEASRQLTGEDFSDREAALGKLKAFVDSYNNTIEATDSIENTSILRRAVTMTGNVAASVGLLKSAGINIEKGNTLSIDEEDFKKADTSVLTTLFGGRLSLASRVSTSATVMGGIASNKLSSITGTYNHTGSYHKVEWATKIDKAV